jgi:hypothetical protein
MSEARFPNGYARICKRTKTRNLRKSILASKVVNPFTCAFEPHPTFTGRRRDFYILRLPSNLGNIPSVNMYMSVFYIPWFAELISYIYKLATRSHLESGLLALLLWLGSFMTSTPSSRRFAGKQLPALHRWNLRRSRIITKLTANSTRNRAFLSSWRSSKPFQTWNKKQTCEFMVIRRLFRPRSED